MFEGFISGDGGSLWLGGNGVSPRSICGDKGALKLSFGVLSRVGSLGAESSLELFKSYSLLTSISGSF